MKHCYSAILLICSLTLSQWVFAEAGYYVLINGQQKGPHSMEQLRGLQQNQQMNAQSLVWKEGMSGWLPAGEQADLKPLFASAPPPPPPSAMAPPPPPTSGSSSTSDVSQADVNEQNKLSKPIIESATDSIDDWSDQTITKFGRNPGEFGEKDGKFLLYASQAVSLKSTDPQYGDALINAYDKAMTKIQEQYVMTRFGKTITDKAKSFYSDRSTNAKELELPPPTDPRYISRFLAIFEKSLDVANKKLDKELIAMGEDPEQFKTIPYTIKKDLFREKFIKTTMRKASGSISGLFPIQTAVVTDKKGKTLVGVIAIASPKTIQIGKDIKLQRKAVVKGKGRDINTLLPNNTKDYLHVFGTRLTYDQDGTPAIISYGVSSYRADTDDDYINDELKSEAKSDAVSNADAQIAEIINGHMNVNNERQRGEEIRKFVEREVKADSDTIEKNIKNIIKITNNSVKSTASAKLQGISTVKSWRYTAETGQKYVGAVRVWKYATLKAIQNFNKSKYGAKPKPTSFQESYRYSKPVNSMDDF